MNLVVYHLTICSLTQLVLIARQIKQRWNNIKVKIGRIGLFSQDNVQYNELVQDLVHPAAG